jgi:nitrite reductase/ring-hydroxylating ferredoxin subunit
MRREDNELITRIGPGTPMGEVFRRYWTPIAVASQVVKRDSDPVRVRFCGEDYVLFRDTNGRLGLMDELCPHRGASLALARVEDCGIRCLYHGWKYDVDDGCSTRRTTTTRISAPSFAPRPTRYEKPAD